MAKQGLRRLSSRAAIVVAAIVGSVSVSSALAAIDLRVESRPVSNPIEGYVAVTDAAGNPVGGLTVGSFTLMLDGNPITIQPGDFSPPPSANPDKNVSVVFAMDYSTSITGDLRAAMEGAVVDFINSMNVGDYAAIVKFNGAAGASIFQQLTRIDGAAGTDALVNAAMLPRTGTGSIIYDGINVTLDHFISPPTDVTLPAGPRAVVVISDGLDNTSINTQGFVIDKASSIGIPLFAIDVGAPGSTESNVMNALAARTGGNYISAPTQAEITSAYATIASRLDNGYLLSFASSITDCNPHTLSVAVAGQGTAEARFTRCDVTTGPVTVPNVVNQAQAAASTAITGAGLVVGAVTQQSSATVAAGRVMSQNPAAGVGVAAGSAVNLVVSTGPAPAPGPIAVPNVVNLTQPAATMAITGAGLVVGTISQRSSTTVPAGSVISQNPSAGASVTLGSAVAMIVSTGPVVVPDVWGLTEPEAITAITGAGLAVGTVRYEPSAEVPSDSVKHTRPWAGTSVAAGSAVALVVSTGPLVTVPNLANLTEDAAREALDAAYLRISYITKHSSATVPSGLVSSQNPDAGTSVAAYSSVSFVVSTGPPVMVTVPNVMNRRLEDAERALRDAGLLWGKIPLAYSPTVPAGSVSYQSPSGGDIVEAGSWVLLMVSIGPDPTLLPTVALAASPTSIVTGTTTTLTWSSTNATACTASGGWSGTRATNGSAATGALSATTSFTLTCTGPGGSGSQTVIVSVTPPAKKSGGGGAADFALLAMLLGVGLGFGRKTKGKF